MKQATPITLSQTGIYTALEILLGTLVPPIVGDPAIALSISNTPSTQVVGNLYIGTEYSLGFTWREFPSLEAASYRDSDAIDGFFADDEMVVRVNGPLQSDQFKGTITYRLRASGETQCKTTSVTSCVWVPYCTRPAPNGNCYVQWQYYSNCHTEKVFDAPACNSYMNSADSNVKALGSFEVEIEKWLK